MASFNETVNRYPVTKTGVYRNERAGQLEFWFCMYGKRALVGACSLACPSSVQHQWARHTREQLSAMLTDAAVRAAAILKAEHYALAKRIC